MGSSRNPKSPTNKALVPAIVSPSSGVDRPHAESDNVDCPWRSRSTQGSACELILYSKKGATTCILTAGCRPSNELPSGYMQRFTL
ncbi:hypothetical protein SprV_0401646400 [Sparganum proliferum]